MLDYITLLHATVLSMTLKGLVNFISGWSAYLRKADAWNHKEKMANMSTVYCVIFNFLMSKLS